MMMAASESTTRRLSDSPTYVDAGVQKRARLRMTDARSFCMITH
jgi:hypothetical protein